MGVVECVSDIADGDGKNDAADGKADYGAAQERDGIGAGEGALSGLDAQQGHIVRFDVEGGRIGEVPALEMIPGVGAEGAGQDRATVGGEWEQPYEQKEKSVERERRAHGGKGSHFSGRAEWRRLAAGERKRKGHGAKAA